MSCKNPDCKTVGRTDRVIRGGWCTANACKRVRAATCQQGYTQPALDVVAVALGLEPGLACDDLAAEARAIHCMAAGMNSIMDILRLEHGCSVDEVVDGVRLLVKKRKRNSVG